MKAAATVAPPPPLHSLHRRHAAPSPRSAAFAVNQNKDTRKSLDVGLWQINDMVSHCNHNDCHVGAGVGGDDDSVVHFGTLLTSATVTADVLPLASCAPALPAELEQLQQWPRALRPRCQLGLRQDGDVLSAPSSDVSAI